ncbi:MAG TPA: CheR family methyltransferase, partial [Pyrinomonadaceae bacterium]|nr:CheR family methyltransferase [Pyrinomonadaceae bacterium]
MSSTSGVRRQGDAEQTGGKTGGDFLIVGIGASAGGIQALKGFFQSVPADSSIAYVVILHLSPDHDSQLAEILQTVAPIPVAQVRDESVRVEPNHVYVIPPNKSLAMNDGHLALSPIQSYEERRAPVDIFFRTLAESHDSRAVSVILSGTGADGSMGMKRVKEKGGIVIVQDPREAEYDDMPKNSLAAGLVDYVLPVREIPAQIIAYRDKLRSVRIAVAPEDPQRDETALREIFTQLRVKTGHDFSNYKRATVLRRIECRIGVRELENLPAYAKFMREQREEAQILLKDLLISVTNFFRDRAAFEALEQNVLPKIFHGKTSADEVRIWVAGCATGEEAYSLAMLCVEHTANTVDAPAVQIFATDIDEAAIASARDGFYTNSDVADVSPDRLRKFFVKEGVGFRVRRELREMILFARHNIIKDPPFSHLDLATCRNLLIYLNRAAQARVMETFHFALNPGGYLFLGSSESIDDGGDLYATLDRENRIFQSRAVLSRPVPPVPGMPTVLRSNAPRETPLPETHALERMSLAALHQQLLEAYAPPSILVNTDYDIVHLSERAGRYLQIQGGEPSYNLLKVVRPELRLELRGALYQAAQNRQTVSVNELPVRIDERDEAVNITVRPVWSENETARGFLMVLFERVKIDGARAAPAAPIAGAAEPVAVQLEAELVRVKAQLRSATQQYEVQAEELKASNEELQAINEELRSAAGELETGKEELQSVNEELMTVNQELKTKIEELSQSNSDFQNLMNSTDIGTIFLDRAFGIKLFTPAAREIFNLLPADYGRPLSDITHRLADADLLRDAEFVLQKLHAVEREVSTADGSTFLMRISPYRTSEDRISGLIMTFVQITERKRMEEQLRQSVERFRALVSQATSGVVEGDFDGDFTFVNKRFCDITGYTEAELLGMNVRDVTHPDDLASNLDLFRRMASEGAAFEIEKRYVRKDGSIVWVHNNVSVVRDAEGNPQSSVTVVVVDVTSRRLAKGAFRESEERLRESQKFVQGIITSVPVSLYIFDLRERKNIYLSPQVSEMF